MEDNGQGWVLLYRKIRDNPLWQEKPFDRARAWVDLILRANHKDNDIFIRGRNIKEHVKRGQTWISERGIGGEWGWGPNKVKSYLLFLQDNEMVRIEKTTRHGTLITIVNYCNYQDSQAGKGNQAGHRWDTPETQTGLNKEINYDELSDEEWERMVIGDGSV